jgi:hypothetical protein
LHMTDAQAEHAMQLCWDICAEKVNLTELNQRSLVWRRHTITNFNHTE